MSRVLFAGGGTGGHLYPAIALAEALERLRPGTEVHFVGAKRGVEARVLPTTAFPHTLLDLEPLRRDRVWRNWRLIPSAFSAVRGLSRLFRGFRPGLVVGTGGYASAPAGAWAVLRGVPLAVQEQNAFPGLTTRLLSRYAKLVALGFPEAAEGLKPGRGTEVVVMGNPIRPPDPTLDRLSCRREFGLPEDGVVALIVGGSQGSLAMNEALLGALEQVAAGEADWPAGLAILWATGPAHLDAVRARLERLGGPSVFGERVRVVGYIETMPRALAAADLAVSRAGAMATAELLAWRLPAILVPLPTAAANHQTHNARALAEAGAAVALPQREASPERLWSELRSLVVDGERRHAMAERAGERARPDAADRIAGRLLELLEAA